ncbi:MAG: hypothetical protein AAFQ98_25315 [Bacteroidota bacterium]
MAEEKILTLHPQGKAGVNILKRRYDVIAEYILKKLKDHPNTTFSDLADEAYDDLQSTFDGKVVWYVTSVKLDLEARGMIERVPKTSPHQLRLVDATKST